MTDTGRITRDRPARSGPLRTQTAWKAASAPAEPERPDGASADPDAPSVSEAVARAVRMGYDVIGQNIEEGRLAAERFRTGQYSIRDVPSDLSALSLRLLGLTRELSVTTFDILERLLRDPSVAGGMQARRGAPGPLASGHQAPDVSAAAAEAETLNVPISCTFKGARTATVKAATLMRPKTPTTLSVAGLASLDNGAPRITDVAFKPALDGYGVIAEITLKDDQPAGVYSGVVCGADTQMPLGLLTIQILP